MARISDHIAPCDINSLAPNDIVLARIQGRRYSHILMLHLLHWRVRRDRFQIGTAHGRVDGCRSQPEHIFGVVTHIETPDTKRAIEL